LAQVEKDLSVGHFLLNGSGFVKVFHRSRFGLLKLAKSLFFNEPNYGKSIVNFYLRQVFELNFTL